MEAVVGTQQNASFALRAVKKRFGDGGILPIPLWMAVQDAPGQEGMTWILCGTGFRSTHSIPSAGVAGARQTSGDAEKSRDALALPGV